MAWTKKASLKGPQGLGVVDLLANKLWSGTAAVGSSVTANYLHSKTMIGATLAGYATPLVGFSQGGVAYLHGTFCQGNVFYDLYAQLTIATNKATVTATRVYAAGDGMDYGRSVELAPAVTAIYGI